jgi:DNA polymerase III subunit delta
MIFKSYLVEKNLDIINKNLILFYGENFGLKNELKKRIKFQNKTAETINFFQEDLIKNKKSFLNEIFNKSLFEEEKIYFINQASDKILDILKEIEINLDDQKIYLFSDQLDKRSKLRNYFEKSENAGAVACYADNEITLKRIILDRLRNFKGLSPQSINMIIENCNLDRDKLNNEINKIVTYFIDKNIDYNKLEALLDIRVNDNFSLLKDEALNGNKHNTNKRLSDTVIIDEKNILYLNIINQRLNKLNEITILSKSNNLEDAVNMIKPPIFWKDKPIFIEQTKKWNSTKIKNILKKTYELEIRMKSNSSINKNTLMKKLLIEICELANVS